MDEKMSSDGENKKSSFAIDERGLSRRAYLAVAGSAVAVAIFVAVYYLSPPRTSPTPTPSPTPSPTPTPKPTPTQAPTQAPTPTPTPSPTPTPPETGKSLVSIVRGKPDADIETMVRKAVDAIGGIGQIVSEGKMVVVKPAVLTSDPNCAPDSRVVAAVAKLAKEAGGKVIVAESSGGGDTGYCLSKVGITSAAEQVEAEVRVLPSEEEILLEVPNGEKLQSVKTYPTISKCDVLISVPRLKRHSSATVTISLKNMMGTIPQSEMGRFHRTDLSQCIADLNTVIKPDMTVVDATDAMARTGPTGGEMIKMNTIMASRDLVAVDTVAAKKLQELEQQMGIPSFDATKVKHINAAAALKVGTNDLNKIVIIEENIS